MKNLNRIKACRICNTKSLVRIGSLGNIPISDFTKKPEEGKLFPLRLVYCKECTLLQLDQNMPRDEIYKEYWYQSGLNKVILDDLEEIAKKGLEYFKYGVWIDAACNDGSLLANVPDSFYRVGIDPAKNIKPKNADSFVNNYFERYSGYKGHIITAIAVLYALPNPNKFMRKVKEYLSEDGVFIAQLMTLEPMIENNDFANIVMEHVEYYSYKSLVTLYERNGLEIFKVEKNNINGGSYRLYARHYQKGSIDINEKEYTVTDLKDFFKRIKQNYTDFMAFLIRAKIEKKKIYGYAASTKANLILSYYRITNKDIEAIVDIHPNKKGKFTIGSKIPIIDYIPKECDFLWVFPYGFIDFFRKKEKSYKGKWITTIPQFKIF